MKDVPYFLTYRQRKKECSRQKEQHMQRHGGMIGQSEFRERGILVGLKHTPMYRVGQLQIRG